MVTKTTKKTQTRRKVAAVKTQTTHAKKTTSKPKRQVAAKSTKQAPKKTRKKVELRHTRQKIASRSEKLAMAIAQAGLDTKAEFVEAIDVREKVDYTDFVVVMSGRSDRQVSAIARNIEETIQKKMKLRCKSVEGLSQSVWVLMDYMDVVVHIFHEEMRSHYNLETLWLDAKRVHVK